MEPAARAGHAASRVMSVDDLLSPGALFLGRFRIEHPLGRGGMGEVWAAVDAQLERPVAIKIMHRALAADGHWAQRFLRETKIVARLAHPNIVRLYDAGAAADGRLYMIMERVFGATLRQRLAAGAPIDVVRALHWAIQIADALAVAHRAALVHRDVKPENILVCDDVHARLLDFGVAKDGQGAALTRLGVVVGTSRYMAPEQIAGRADGRADLYALGVVLYEMLAGAHPYPALDGDTGVGETAMQAAHVHLAPAPLPDVLPGCPAALWRAVATCLAKRPEDRFARAEDLAEALRAAAQRAVVAAPPEHAAAREIVRDAADAARARALRGGAGEAGAPAQWMAATAPLPVGFTPASPLPARPAAATPAAASPAPACDAMPESFAKARMFRVVPGGLVPLEAPAGEPARDAAGAGAAPSPQVTTERWDGAAMLAAGREPLATTETWDGAARRAGVAAERAGSRRVGWRRFSMAAALLAAGILAAALVGWVMALLRRG